MKWRRGYTIPGTGRSKGAVTSQFENHLRAVMALPLGSTNPIGSSAMLNLDRRSARRRRSAHRARRPSCIFTANRPAPGRKLGHVTLRGGLSGATCFAAWGTAGLFPSAGILPGCCPCSGAGAGLILCGFAGSRTNLGGLWPHFSGSLTGQKQDLAPALRLGLGLPPGRPNARMLCSHDSPLRDIRQPSTSTSVSAFLGAPLKNNAKANREKLRLLLRRRYQGRSRAQ